MRAILLGLAVILAAATLPAAKAQSSDVPQMENARDRNAQKFSVDRGFGAHHRILQTVDFLQALHHFFRRQIARSAQLANFGMNHQVVHRQNPLRDTFTIHHRQAANLF
jgi:hypothetical protein